MRLAFFGTPDFSVPALQALVDAEHEIACVYTQPPRAAGRGEKERRSAVHETADKLGLTVRTPQTLKDGRAQAEFAALDLDAAVVVAYGLILPKPVLEAPRHGCINIHASLLPRWRGAAPIHRAILAGDAETGVTIMAMDEGLDTGPELSREAIPIAASATAETLHDQLSALGARLIVEALAGLAEGRITPVPQTDDGATYAAKLTREEGRLDWDQPAAMLERQVRAFSPWPGAWFNNGGDRLKVLAAEVVAGSGAPGTVLDDQLTVACGEGALRILEVQREGRAPVDAAALLRGYPIAPGSVLA
ncbi:MAG: methionyl-tRNA formyltransferase [Alphaproteobacteria bacterium]|nr:methionyl-tRNA formyltransferase [Alphaproteobacteria bacterium]